MWDISSLTDIRKRDMSKVPCSLQTEWLLNALHVALGSRTDCPALVVVNATGAYGAFVAGKAMPQLDIAEMTKLPISAQDALNGTIDFQYQIMSTSSPHEKRFIVYSNWFSEMRSVASNPPEEYPVVVVRQYSYFDEDDREVALNTPMRHVDGRLFIDAEFYFEIGQERIPAYINRLSYGREDTTMLIQMRRVESNGVDSHIIKSEQPVNIKGMIDGVKIRGQQIDELEKSISALERKARYLYCNA